MDAIKSILDVFLHVDDHLHALLEAWGPWTYVLLFAIILCETGLVIMPFLPGDSLLFAAGAMAALYPDDLGFVTLLVLLSIAAILGDTINYFLGRWIGPRAFSLNTWFLKHEHLEKTQAFYDRHGGKTIVLARFMPIVRTFAPFVAGVGKMHYPTFLWFNVVGGILWVVLCTAAGYFFGNIEAVKKNFELVVIGIVLVSVLPLAWEWWAARRRSQTG
ncbi:MAG: DedA family protein [Planctomycetaceae bacterium]|jgi:membrane-associated protein|nr:DedA family protein [Planctomycetaceae bacterium]